MFQSHKLDYLTKVDCINKETIERFLFQASLQGSLTNKMSLGIATHSLKNKEN